MQDKYQNRRYKRLELKRKNKINFLRRVFGGLILVLFIGGINYVLFFCPIIRIKETKISGVKAEVESQIREKTKEFLSKKTLLVFPNDSIILFSSNKLKADLETLGAIKNVSASWKIPSSLEIRAEERLGVLNWCQADQCSVVDEEGTEISELLNSDFVIVNSECQGRKPQVEKISFIKKISSAFFQMDLKPVSFYLKNCFTQKLAAKTSKFEIYFDLSRPVEDQIEVLRGVLENKNRTISKYIDLQVEGRVFYE